MLIDVASADELREGVPLVVQADGRRVAVIRWRERIYAIRDVCPHQTASFDTGYVHNLVTGSDLLPELAVYPDDPVLVCPRHGYQFLLRTGGCTGAPALRARTYDVDVKDGRVLLEIRARQ